MRQLEALIMNFIPLGVVFFNIALLILTLVGFLYLILCVKRIADAQSENVLIQREILAALSKIKSENNHG